MIVCVAGLPGSGKTTVAKLLKKRGFELVEMGDLVREKMKEKKIAITPESIKKYAISIRTKYGKGIVAKYAMLKIKEISQKKNVAIIGIRSMQEFAAFKKKFKGIRIIAVVAPTKQRYERLVKRSWANDPKNFAKFEERERQERAGYAKHGKKTEGVLSLVDNADYLICNTENFVRLSKDMNILTAKLRHLE
ncbi:MAG: AAA family ATPase [Candidatus Micrarchaeota archaeon]|nr:AAA family ATPase [Candidatus Micrarchaeota archaeon]